MLTLYLDPQTTFSNGLLLKMMGEIHCLRVRLQVLNMEIVI